jgi:cell division protein FtsB
LDAKIAELVAGRDDVVRQLESRAQEVRQLREHKETLEQRIAELQRLRERMAWAIRSEFGIDVP